MKKWIILIIGLIGLDQLTKWWTVSTFAYEGDTIAIIPNFFHFTYVRNSGAVFGIFQGLAEQYIIFLVIISIAIVIFGYMFYKNDFKDKRTFWYSLGLSLLIAGAFGNAIDRMFQPDHNVVDFIDFRGIWAYIFNVADICLNVGIVIFIVDTLFLEHKRKKVDG